MPRVLIIGYGNPLRGDDGFGYRAAERLQHLVYDPETEVLAVHQLTPELMDPVSRAESVIFLDAREGPVPGEVQERVIDPDPATPLNFTHHFTPDTLVAGARTLYGRAASAVLITCAGARFGCSYHLSQSVQVSLDRTVLAVLRRASSRCTLP
jgi:hydrogenase maturation protease